MEELYDTTDASNPWWKYPVTGDENETDLFGGASAAYNRGALALAALRSTVGDAKFREIEKTWVQEHQEQFDPTGLKITATYSDKSTKAIDPTDEAVTYHYDFAKPSGATKITVTYDGQTASFTVKVTADAGNKTGNNPKQQASPVQNGNTSTQPNGVSNPLSKTDASTAPIIALAALALLTGGVNADTAWLFAAWLRWERSLWGNAVAMLATSMMTVVIASFGDRMLPLCGAGGSQVSCDAVAQYRQGIRALPDWRSWTDVQAWWPAYSAPKAALTAAIVFALTQYGSVLFVKTMIREYGKDPTWWPHGCGTRRLPSPGSPSICGWVSSRSSC